MSPIAVIATVAAYFAVLMAISAIASRGSDNATFFTGNRKAPWPLVAFASIGAAISGVTFISVPGMVAAKGHAYLQMVLGFIVGYIVIAVVLVPMFYRRNLVSIYGYLGQRFGIRSYRSGAWIFFISKMLGASVRFFVVCAVLQSLVFSPLGIPFEVNVIATVALIWLYTVNGGVKTLIWTDTIKSICLIGSVVLSIAFVSHIMGFDFHTAVGNISAHESSRIFFFDDPFSGSYFWKQFVAGVFMAIATNGLDQDMMQRHLACRDSVSSRKNMIISGIMQFFVIALFLVLGTLLVMYAEFAGISFPAKSDELFGIIATHETMPVAVGIVFIIGLIASAYSAAGSALTSLTTSFTVDILDGNGIEERKLARMRRLVHAGMAVTMGVVIIVFYLISEDDAISAVYTLASYTYGPILGLFIFGMFTSWRVNDRIVPVLCLAAPLACLFTRNLLFRLWGYEMSFELLLLNALYTFTFLAIASLVESRWNNRVIEDSV